MPRQKHLLRSRIVVKNFFRFIQHETKLIDRDGNVGRALGDLNPRPLPCQGAGAISSWLIERPRDTNRFYFDS